MTIFPKIRVLIAQINREITETKQEVEAALRIIRPLLNSFPGSEYLIQSFAALSNVDFFASNLSNQIENIVSQISPAGVPDKIITEAGEELGAILGRVLEAKINASSIKRQWE